MKDLQVKLSILIDDNGAQVVSTHQGGPFQAFDLINDYDDSDSENYVFYGLSGEEYVMSELTIIDQHGKRV